MDLTTLLIQLVSGAVGGQAAAGMTKDDSLGTIGNMVVGALGGGIGGHVLSSLLGLGAAAGAGLDVGAIVSAVLTGGVAGGVSTFLLSMIKSKLAA